MRLGGAILLVCALLAGCGEGGTGQEPTFIGDGLLFNRDAPPKGAEDFQARAAAGAPLMLVSLEDLDRQAIAVFVSEIDGDSTWRTPDEITFSFRDNMMLRTRGLNDDLMSADVDESRALVLGLGTGLAVRVHRYLDGQDRTTIDSYVCEIKPRGPREISFDGHKFQTVLMQERCNNTGNSFQNLYWVQNGRILQSKQWISAKSGAMSMRVVIR